MKYCHHFIIVIIIGFCALPVQGQTGTQPWEQYYEELIDNEDEDGQDIEAGYEILCELADNKIDLNSATQEDLERLIFLSETQIEEIAEYVYRYGPVRTFGELGMIESLDPERRNLLPYFVTLGNEKKKRFPSLETIGKYGKHELTATAKIPMYERKGDREGYAGYKYKHWFRYTFNYGQYVKAGFVGSQDSGEPFFAGRNRWGYDYYSFYVAIRNAGRLKSLAVGRYRMRFGMGLVMNNDFTFGKSAALSSPNAANAIRGHSSRSEYNYLQGAAATIEIVKGLDATAFVSYRKIDATLGKDSTTITTILKTGYHRTISEMARKHNTSQFLCGGNIRYAAKGFQIGATFVHTSLDKELRPFESQLFRKHYPHGRDFTNIGTDYGYTGHNLSAKGETAIDRNGNVATLNRMSWLPTGNLSLTVLQRFYSYRYQTLTTSAFSEGGRIQNESGIYAGIDWSPLRNVMMKAYVDYAYFAWPRYRVSGTSSATDGFVSANYTANSLALSARYRIRIRQRDDNNGSLRNLNEHRCRLTASYTDGCWTHSVKGDFAVCTHKDSSKGWMATYSSAFRRNWLDMYAYIAYFDTDSYDSRLYAYERGMMYSFAFPMFYGNGIHFAIGAKTDIGKRLAVRCKIGTTKYFDRDKISSSYQTIDSSSMTDIDIQVRWKF